MKRMGPVLVLLLAACSDGSGKNELGTGTAPADARASDADASRPEVDVEVHGDLVTDDDFDGVDDSVDNCVGIFNPKQEDVDSDKIGDLCDDTIEDGDGDGIPDEADPFPTDGTRPGVVTSKTIYAHSASELYVLDIKTTNVYLVGAFAFPSGTSSTEMTDIAIDRHGVLYGISFDDVFVIDPRTAHCWRLAALPQEFNGLTLISRDELGTTEDAMIGIANDGVWWRLELVAIPGTATKRIEVTRFGDYGGAWTSSGDAFSIAGLGTFASVDTNSTDRDALVEVDPKTGAVKRTIGNIGNYEQVWGLAGWTNLVFGFDASGKVLVIDLTSGTITSEKDMDVEWWGAGVRTIID